MSRKNGSSMAKRIVAVIALVAVAASSVFASPLNLAGSIGNTRIYNEQFKSVEDHPSVNDGWVVRTLDDELSLGNDAVKLVIGQDSLIRVIDLSDEPSIYLLDGKLAVKVNEGEVIVKTPTAQYKAAQGSTVVVLSTDEEESIYVHEGEASATDEISSVTTSISAGSYAKASVSGFVEYGPSEDVVAKADMIEEPEIEETEEAETSPEAVPIVEPTPSIEVYEEAAEPVVEPAVEDVPAVEPKPLAKTLSYAGYEATITAYVGKALIQYPAFVTAQEIYDAAAAALAAYPAQLRGVTIRVVGDGLAEVRYPQSYGKAEFDYAVSLLEKELPYYIASLFAPKAPIVPGAPNAPTVSVEVHEEAAEPVVEPAVEDVPAVEPKPLAKTLSYAGYEATITAYVGKALVQYPAFVTAQEIYDAAAAALAAYPAQLRGVTIRVVGDGLAEVRYPQSYGKAEFDYAVSLLEKELPYYIAFLFAPKAEEKVSTAPVEPDVAIQIHEEERVPEAPAEQMVHIETKNAIPMQEQTAKTDVNVGEQPAVESESAKESGLKFGATIAVEYGTPNTKAEYKSIVQDEVFRLGLFWKSATIMVDPYITTGDFTLALHFALNSTDPKSSISFDTANGIAGYVSSVFKYIGGINYGNENSNIRLDIDRVHEFNFVSPVVNGFDRAFDENARMAASFDGEFGILGISAFIDDLELNNKLQGKKQFAGMRFALNAGSVGFGLSAVADVRNVDILAKQFGAELYPAADLSIPFAIGSSNVEIALGAATRLTIGDAVDFNSIPYFAKLNVKASNDLYYVGVGAAYSNGSHLTSIVGNSITSITKMNTGMSIDALLSAGLSWGPISIDGSMNLPFSLDGTGLFVYNEVKTRSGMTQTITADTLKVKASISFGGFALDCGIMFDGFCGKLADLSQALIRRQDTTEAIRGIQDPDLGAYFVGLSYENDSFRLYLKGSYMAINNATVNTRALVLTSGASVSF